MSLNREVMHAVTDPAAIFGATHRLAHLVREWWLGSSRGTLAPRFKFAFDAVDGLPAELSSLPATFNESR
jgi:hypothetical protein